MENDMDYGMGNVTVMAMENGMGNGNGMDNVKLIAEEIL